MSDIPPKNALDQKPASDKKEGQSSEDNQGGTSADFAALIDTIKNEGIAYRKEEQREDRGKRFREWVTIGLIFCTVVAVGWQVYEMIKVYGPVKIQADAAVAQSKNSEMALIQAQRAWVGPQNAAFTAEPAIGKSLETMITYQNSGHEPALGFRYYVNEFTVIDNAQSPTSIQAMNTYLAACKDLKNWEGGSVIYPTNSGLGGSVYTLNYKSDEKVIDDAVLKGDKIVIVQGCFVYRSFSTPHHAYFCYFYKHDLTKIQNLNICPVGHDAD